MKKACYIMVLVVAMCMIIVGAWADEEEKGPLESIGSFFSDAWNSVSDWVDTAFSDASAWVETAWGDASAWIDEVWNDTASWTTEIWGDASTWAVASFDSASETVSNWWTETFETVTDTSQKVWEWLQKEVPVTEDSMTYITQIKTVVSLNDSNAENQVKALFYELLSKANIKEEDADRVWKTVYAFAASKGVSQLATAKLSLPYLLKLAMDEQSESGRNIPAIAVAQYLTGIHEKLGVQSDDIADQLLVSLADVLGNIIN